MAKDDIKRNTGIPRSFIGPDGQALPPTATDPAVHPVSAPEKTEIPEDLICSICKDLFVDAVMIPCCGSSFCDDCVRTALLESEDNECPDCKEKGTSPNSLIPNRFLRNSVNSFKNETGYNRPGGSHKKAQDPQPSPKEVTAAATVTKSEEVTEESIGDETAQDEEKEEGDTEEKAEQSQEEAEGLFQFFNFWFLNIPPHNKNFFFFPFIDDYECESDFDDNITVTVPPPHLTSHGAYQERFYHGRHPRLKPPGIETPPKPAYHHQISHEDRSMTPTVDEKESYNSIPSTDHRRTDPLLSGQQQSQLQPPSHQQQLHQQQQQQQMSMGMPSHMGGPQSQNGHGVKMHPMDYQQQQQQQQHPQQGMHPQYDANAYQMQPQVPYGGGYPPHQAPNQMAPYRHERPRGSFMPPRMPYGGGNMPPYGGGGPNQMNIRGPRHTNMMGHNNLAMVYQGVQAKVGTG